VVVLVLIRRAGWRVALRGGVGAVGHFAVAAAAPAAVVVVVVVVVVDGGCRW